MIDPTARSSPELLHWLREMPKAELHLHLDGSMRPATALELARDRDVGLDGSVDLEDMRRRLIAPERCLDQVDLLRAFDLPTALLQDREALARCTTELIEDVAADGTRYAEVRWAPSLHTERGLSLHAGTAAVVEAAARAAQANGIEVRLIAVALRTHAVDIARDVVRTALDFVGDGLTGFDFAGRERDAPDPRVFESAFELAREGGLGISCHAGEWGGPAQVWAALAIEPWRIAHGAPAAHDERLMAVLRDRGVSLDICPTSSAQAGIAALDRDAPLPRLIRAGVPVTISTDDRTVSDLTLNEELRRAVDRLGVTPDEIVQLQRQAYATAFLHRDEPLRAALQRDFEAWAARHPTPAPLGGGPA